VAEALATGPEGTYLLSVDRVANGVEWTMGGGNAHCLDTYAVKTSEFLDGKILDINTSEDKPYKLSFRTLDDNGNPSLLTIKIDNDGGTWKLRAEVNGEAKKPDGTDWITPVTVGDELTTTNLRSFINSTAGILGINLNVDEESVTRNGETFYTLKFTAPTTDNKYSPVEVTDYSGIFGTLTEAKHELSSVLMRTDPHNIEDALNISGSFRIQVGTQGTRVTSENFRQTSNLAEGEILSEGTAGEKHTFRIGVSGDQVDFTVSWNSSTNRWVLSSDLGTNKTVGEKLTVKDLTDFMTETLSKNTGADTPVLKGLKVVAGKSSTGVYTQFYVESKDNYLLSISDVEGNLAKTLGIVNENPVITIDVESSDSLITIRNKINEKYQEELGLTEPEQWVHASTDNGYLEIFANVAGEAQRITLMGAEDGNMQVLRRLGLTQNQQIISDIKDENDEYLMTYREITYIPDTGIAKDASFSLNGVKYLSADNKFNMARRIPAATTNSKLKYSATELSEVETGMWLNLKDAG
ncbi:MAG: hypothetical protein IJP96_11590, partial [Synergistaceae bacterium]|nr:hypothetical protein [Synergistaceae bacterium]